MQLESALETNPRESDMYDVDFNGAIKFTSESTDEVFSAEMKKYGPFLNHSNQFVGARCVIGMGSFLYGTLSQAVIEEMIRSGIEPSTPWLPQQALEITNHLMDQVFNTPAEKLDSILEAVKHTQICREILELGANMVRFNMVDPVRVSEAICRFASVRLQD